MITTLTVKCPHCEQISQIYLSTSVCVIILNCPSCLSPIMYFRQKIFLLDPKQLKKITGDTRGSAVFKLIEQITQTAEPCPVQKAANLHNNASYGPGRSEPLTIEQPEEKYITGDDWTNLRIDLELSGDSQEFIDRL